MQQAQHIQLSSQTYSRVQIFGRACDFHHEVRQPAQSVSDARLLLTEPVVVRYAHVISSFQPRVFALNLNLK